MLVTPIKTRAILPNDSIETVLDESLVHLNENSIVVITSKIISTAQGRVLSHEQVKSKKDLIISEVDDYIDASEYSPYDVMLTIKDDILIANGGIDESNGNGLYILWPERLHETTTHIWEYLRTKHKLNNLGIIVTDSRLIPMRWGTVGVAMSWCGFRPLKNYIGAPDIFGRNLEMTKASHIDGLAGAAVLVMGEGNEQTPIALIEDVPFVSFQDSPPTQKEIEALRIKKEEDIYSPITNSDKWKKGALPPTKKPQLTEHE